MQFLLTNTLMLLMAFVLLKSAHAETPISMAAAGKIYSENCAVCHGDHGDGKSRARYGLEPPPRDFTSPGAAAELNRQRMINSVVAGRKGTAMVAWHGRLSMAEIEGVVDYIRATFMVLAPTEEELAAEGPEMELGKKIFEENCRVCHGDRGNGATWTNSVLNPPPRNFTSPQARRMLTRKRMLASVQYGRKGTAMQPFGGRLSETEIQAVVDYIRATFMKGPVVADAGMMDLAGSSAMGGHSTGGGHAHGGMGNHAPSSFGSAMAPNMSASDEKIDMAEVMPMGLTGHFEAGRKIYYQNCATCHGVRGDGLGPRSSFINPKPRNFLHSDSRATLNRPALFQKIVVGKPGTVMPAWGKVLGPQQVADVAEFVFQDFIHPNPDDIVPTPEANDDELVRQSMGDKKKAQ